MDKFTIGSKDSYDVALEDYPTEPHVQQSYVTVLKKEEIRELMENHIQNVSEVLSLSIPETIVLIYHYGWDVNEFPIEWFGDAKEEVRENVGLFERPYDSSSDDKEFFCGVCFKSHPLKNSASVSCGHRVCTFCWTEHINVIINENPAAEWHIWLKCPYGPCQASIDRDMIERFASDEEKAKYDQYLLSSYVDYHKTMKLCPASGCSYAIDLDPGFGNSDVSCLCLFRFCWNCREEAHSPVDCKTAAKWVLENTVPCPKCERRVEHNQDFSMKLKCLPPCSHDFCWVCRDHWTGHVKGASCKSDDASYVEDDLWQETPESETAADRCKDYYERWASNELSRQKAIGELQQMQSVQLEKLSDIQCTPESQLKFITEALLQIIECRRVLKWTYAYGYYLPDQSKRQFFEYLQGEAESGLERLHKCVENELEVFQNAEGPSEDFNQFRTKLTSLTSITKIYFENLVKALENGLDVVDSQSASSKSINSKSYSKTRDDGKDKGSFKNGGSSRNQDNNSELCN